MAKYGTISTLIVYSFDDVETYKVGNLFEGNKIESIRDNGCESENGNIFLRYELIDKNDNVLASFENGTYATYFDVGNGDK